MISLGTAPHIQALLRDIKYNLLGCVVHDNHAEVAFLSESSADVCG